MPRSVSANACWSGCPSSQAYVEQVEKEHRWLPILAPQLPLPIPEPLAMGKPGCGFPRPWPVDRGPDGSGREVGEPARVTDPDEAELTKNVIGKIIADHCGAR